MSYAAAYRYLLSLHRVPRREYLTNPEECVWYLKRIQFLLDLLGNPERTIPHYIHVAGTSGKGSVCLMLGSILRAAGVRVGVHTSPSPDGILGRAEINGRAMTKTEFVKLISTLKPALKRYRQTSPFDLPSPFEIMTALTLLYFARQKVRWAVIEVGLGGRYDSTNVIPRKDIAVITNIGLDHTEILGHSKTKIAYEKAGIIKPGCQVFTSESDVKVLKVIKRECRQNKVGLQQINFFGTPNVERINGQPVTRYALRVIPRELDGTNFKYAGTNYTLPVLGRHQVTNAALAIEVARSLKIPILAIQRGLARVKLPIRMEVVSRRPLIILDGAHNPDKMKTTVATIRNLQFSIPRHGPLGLELVAERSGQALNLKSLNLVVAFSANKNIAAMVKQLATLKPKTIACTRFTSNLFRKTANPGTLARPFRKLLPRTTVKTFLDPREAFSWSRRQQKTGGLLLATGSIFLSGELRLIFGRVVKIS